MTKEKKPEPGPGVTLPESDSQETGANSPEEKKPKDDKETLPDPTKPIKKSHLFRNTILGLAAAGTLFGVYNYNLHKNNCEQYKTEYVYQDKQGKTQEAKGLERACKIVSIPLVPNFLTGSWNKEGLENYAKVQELNEKKAELNAKLVELDQKKSSLNIDKNYCDTQKYDLANATESWNYMNAQHNLIGPRKAPTGKNVPSKESKNLFKILKGKYSFRSPLYSGYTPEDSDKLSLTKDGRHYIEERGLRASKVDGEKFLISTSKSLQKYAETHKKELNAIIITEDGNTLEEKLVDGNASIDLNGKKYTGVAVYTDGNLVLASHTSKDLVKTLKEAPVVKKPGKAPVAPASEAPTAPAKTDLGQNEAPYMLQELTRTKVEKDSSFDAIVAAADKENDKITFSIEGLEGDREYQFSVNPIIEAPSKEAGFRQKALVRTVMPVTKDNVNFRVCAIDEKHPVKDEQCMEYNVNMDGTTNYIVKGQIVNAPLEWGEETGDAGKQATPEDKAKDGELIYSMPMPSKAAGEEKDVEPEQDTKGLEAVLEEDTFTLHPFWRLPYRPFDEGNERIPMNVELSKYEPDDLRRIYLGDPHKGKYGIIVHTDSDVGNLIMTSFDIDSGASKTKKLRVNHNNNAKIHGYDIPRGADIVVVEDPESNDKIAFKVDNRIFPSYGIYKTDSTDLEGTFVPYKINENGGAVLRLEKGTYELRENPNFRYMHDEFVIRNITVNDVKQDITSETFKFDANKDINEIMLSTKADSRPEETTIIIKIEGEDSKDNSRAASEKKTSEAKDDSKSKEPLQESKRKLNVSFAGGMKDLHAKYETPAWDLKSDGTEYFGRIEGQYNITENTAAGANVDYSQSDSKIKDFGDSKATAVGLGVFTRGSYGDKKVHLTSHAGYDRFFGTNNMEILGTDVEQTSATDRVTLNGILSSNNIGVDGYLSVDFNQLEQDDPDFTRYGRDYRFSIGPVVQTQRWMFEPFFAQTSQHDMESEEDFVGNSAGILAKYDGSKFDAMISAEVPVSNSDLRANEFYAAASIPLYKGKLFLNPGAGFNQVMIDDGNNERLKESTYALIEISTSDLNLRTPHIQKSLYSY